MGSFAALCFAVPVFVSVLPPLIRPADIFRLFRWAFLTFYSTEQTLPTYRGSRRITRDYALKTLVKNVRRAFCWCQLPTSPLIFAAFYGGLALFFVF